MDIIKDSIFAKQDLPLMRLSTTGSGEKNSFKIKLTLHKHKRVEKLCFSTPFCL